MSDGVPPWCRWCRGKSALLLVAPHGGRTSRDLLEIPRDGPLRTNDLHTAELAHDLARRLDASLIANTAFDRNDLDLNRISEVTGKAPWFLALLGELLDEILSRHPVAELVFLHGWNVVQRKCDIGVGASLESADVGAEPCAALTVSSEYLSDRLEALRSSCLSAGIRTAYGERYPAAHRNNLMQLFRRGGERRARGGERLAGYIAAGRIEAVQLELGAPLRWPGEDRARFAAAFEVAFSASRGRWLAAAERDSSRSPDEAPRETAVEPDGFALQAHDPTTGLGLVSGVRRDADGFLGGRLLLFPGGQRLVIFTGQDRTQRDLARGGIHFQAKRDGFTLHFDGAALEVDDGRLYLQTEAAQARSRLIQVRVELGLSQLGRRSYGRVEGTIELGENKFDIATFGFTDPGFARPGNEAARTVLTASFGPDLAVRARLVDGERQAVIAELGDGEPRSFDAMPAGPHFDADGSVPSRLVVPLVGEEPLVAAPESVMMFLRPLGRGRYARITFGVARFAWGRVRQGSGFYEYTRLVAA